MERRLAAILAADVVGYSRLVEADEAAVFERLRAHRNYLQTQQPEASRSSCYKGRPDSL
jgi:class 3 adenylate cyclase